jgi:hypothetical protein
MAHAKVAADRIAVDSTTAPDFLLHFVTFFYFMRDLSFPVRYKAMQKALDHFWCNASVLLLLIFLLLGAVRRLLPSVVTLV